MAKTFGEMLDTSEPSEVETEVAQPEAEAAPAVEDDRPRNPDGTFAKKGDEEGAPPAPAEKQEFDGAATLAERRKRQEAEAELERLREQLKQPPQPAPDMFADPDGWQQLNQQQIDQRLLKTKLDLSEDTAILDHGECLATNLLVLDRVDQHGFQLVVSRRLGFGDASGRAERSVEILRVDVEPTLLVEYAMQIPHSS